MGKVGRLDGGCVSQGSPEKQNQKDIYIYIHTYCKELAHVIMETGKSPDLLSPCWRTRRAKI